MITGAILAGGRNTRIGFDKSFIKINNKPIIEKTVELFKKIFDETIIVTNDVITYKRLDIPIFSDIIKDKGPLSGIYTGLKKSKNDECFFAACDMPFLNENLIRYICGFNNFDLVIPKTDKFQPLHAMYSKSCIEAIEGLFNAGRLKTNSLVNLVNTKVIEETEIIKQDPMLKSFTNINTEQDLKRIRIDLERKSVG